MGVVPNKPLAISMGEPGGVGTEVLLKAYRHFADQPPGKHPTFFVIDDPARVERVSRDLGMDVPITTVSAASDVPDRFHDGLPVLTLRGEALASLAPWTVGEAKPDTARAVTMSIERAASLAAQGLAAGVVTLPIHKDALLAARFPYPGHTEFLGALTQQLPLPDGLIRGPVMLLSAGPFRVAPVTVHIPLGAVPWALTADRVFTAGMVVAQALTRDYGVAKPQLAFAGLNPHAGEGGRIGREDRDIIAPAIEALQKQGVEAVGPLPADTMFHEEARAQYHAALTMYHDQALIPIKTIAFYAAVNVTLGLPIVRTSPDHGTALGIAGKGQARPDSTINAIYAADRISRQRAEFDAAQTGTDGGA